LRLPVTDDLRNAVAAGDVDPAVGADRRRVQLVDPPQPKGAALVFPRLDIEARDDALVVLQRIEGVAVQQGRRYVRRPPTAGPENLVGPGDVALGAVEPDGQQG